MHAPNQQRPARSGNQPVVESLDPIIRWPQPESLASKSALKPSLPRSFFHNVILPESDVPFSPLND